MTFDSQDGADYSANMAQGAHQLSEDRLAALERLTDREKDCLRRRLRHQTAKEMAIDMGLSPHAIEKRLKMARAKLGVSSSLEAARLLAATEEYQATVPQPSDLDGAPTRRKTLGRRSKVVGAVFMSLAVVAIISFMLHPAGPAGESSGLLKPGEILIFGPPSFDELDKDQSGFLEGEEAPLLIRVGGDVTYERHPAGEVNFAGDYVSISDGEALRNHFYREADINQDGKVSPAEFRSWAAPRVN